MVHRGTGGTLWYTKAQGVYSGAQWHRGYTVVHRGTGGIQWCTVAQGVYSGTQGHRGFTGAQGCVMVHNGAQWCTEGAGMAA